MERMRRKSGIACGAFACSTKFNGEMKVWGANGGTATPIGSYPGTMNYCNGWPKGPVSFAHGQTKTLTVDVAPQTDACTGLVRPSGDCMYLAGNGEKSVGTFSISAGGFGRTTVGYAASASVNAAGEAGSICVSDGTHTNVMEDVLVFI